MSDFFVFAASLLGLGTAGLNGWVALRRTQSDKDALTAVADSKATLEQGMIQLSGAVDKVAENLSARFGHAQDQMDRMLDLLTKLVR